jgi:uncharacterized protein YndB with AHSA1/START domain
MLVPANPRSQNKKLADATSFSRVVFTAFAVISKIPLTRFTYLATILLERSTKSMKILTTCSIVACLTLVSIRPAVAQNEAPVAAHPPQPTVPQQFVIEMEVPATLAQVWQAFSTNEGLSTWLTPNATVDLRPGGEWLAHFPGGSTGGGTILSFVPEKEMVISAMAPDQFPHVRAERTRAVFQFEPHGNSTVVRLTQSGWKSGDEWTRAYEYLVAGNAQLLATLHHRFVNGPLDWKKVFGDK